MNKWAARWFVEGSDKTLRVTIRYLSGDVWGYQIERRGEHGEWEQVDGGWGMYGLEYCEQEARAEGDRLWTREKEETEKCERMMLA